MYIYKNIYIYPNINPYIISTYIKVTHATNEGPCATSSVYIHSLRCGPLEVTAHVY